MPRVIVARENRITDVPLEKYDDFLFLDGDEVEVLAIGNETIEQTYDGAYTFRSGSRAFRVPKKVKMAQFRDFNIPEDLVVLTGQGSYSLDYLGKLHIYNYRKYMGLFPEMKFLEIGCGIGRDAFQLIDIISHKGGYHGVDVTREAIVWCEKYITHRYPNFLFSHFDARHEIYNPLGIKTSMDFQLPVADHSIDRVSLGSVFTHLFEAEVTHYLRELARVLKQDGRAYATFFLHSRETIESVNRTNSTPLRFEQPYGDGCYVQDLTYPTGAVAFTKDAVDRMLLNSGLSLKQPLVLGSWSGAQDNADDGQEVAILGLPD